MLNKRKILKRPRSQDVIRKDSQEDYTGPNATDRVLFVNLGLVKFGTTDKLQGAAIFIAIVLLMFILVTLVLGFFVDKDWAKDALGWLGTPLLLVVGVAVGRADNSKGDDG